MSIFISIDDQIDVLFSLSPKHDSIEAFLESFEKMVTSLVKKDNNKPGSEAASVLNFGLEEPGNIRRSGEVQNCFLCQKPGHRVWQCYSF